MLRFSQKLFNIYHNFLSNYLWVAEKMNCTEQLWCGTLGSNFSDRNQEFVTGVCSSDDSLAEVLTSCRWKCAVEYLHCVCTPVAVLTDQVKRLLRDRGLSSTSVGRSRHIPKCPCGKWTPALAKRLLSVNLWLQLTCSFWTVTPHTGATEYFGQLLVTHRNITVQFSVFSL